MNRLIVVVTLVALVLALFAPGTVYAGDMGTAPKTVSCAESDTVATSPAMTHIGPKKKKLKKKRRHRGHHGCSQTKV